MNTLFNTATDDSRLTLPVESISALCGAPARNRRSRPVPAGQVGLFADQQQLGLFDEGQDDD